MHNFTLSLQRLTFSKNLMETIVKDVNPIEKVEMSTTMASILGSVYLIQDTG